MLVIKAGGSVLTRKGDVPVFDRAAAARLAAELALLREPFILTHGTGSFGKPPAVRYGYLGGKIAPGAAPVERINASLLELHRAFLAELLAAGVRAASLPGPENFVLRAGRPVPADPAALAGLLGRGAAPVVSSGIFPDGAGGGTVVSSDALAAGLARLFRPRLAVFLTDSDGVTGPGGRPLREAGARELLRACRPAPGDVSGGMAGKAAQLARIAALGIPAAVTDGRRRGWGARLASGALPGGTFVRPGRRPA